MKKFAHTERAQGAMEFALAFPILLAIVVGLFEFGRAIYVYASVYTASREAARYGLTYGKTEDGTFHYLDCDGIRDLAMSYGSPGRVASGDVSITYEAYDEMADTFSANGTCPNPTVALVLGDRIIVQVIGHFEPAAYLPLLNIPDITITSVNRRTLIQEVPVQ